MTPDSVRGGYAAVLMIGEGTTPISGVPGTAAWHQEHNLWLAGNRWPRLHRGMPVVSRMAGQSNELLMLGTVAGEWAPIDPEFAGWKWPWQIDVAWEQRVVRNVLARDVMGSAGKSRPAVLTVSRPMWKRIVDTMLDA